MMQPCFEIAYYHWIILCLGFWVLELLKIGKISAALVVSAGVMVVVTYLVPALFWGWQVWGFIMMMSLSRALCSKILARSTLRWPGWVFLGWV